jgi:8-oxo-dGTP diphosphatase
MLRRYRAQPLNTERTNVINASAASCSVFRMLLTIDAAPSGCVTRKKTNNAAPDRIRTFLTFTGCYSVSVGGLLNLFLKMVVPQDLAEREVITALGAKARHARGIRLRFVFMTLSDDAAIRCVGAVVHDAEGRLLMVKRANEPGRGQWSLPGGRVEPGESDAYAVARELREETGLEVRVGPLVGSVQRGPFLIFDYAAEAVGGALQAGDDAAAAAWVTRAEFDELDLVAQLAETLTDWQALPRA